MTTTPFTGKAMTFTQGAVTIEGLTGVDINKTDGPDAEQLDTTRYGDTTYTNITDPLGSKGDDKTTVTVTTWASTASYGDTKGSKLAFNTPATGVFDAASGTANANTYTNTALELTARTTTIPFAAFATQTLTLEANDLGTWSAPA